MCCFYCLFGCNVSFCLLHLSQFSLVTWEQFVEDNLLRLAKHMMEKHAKWDRQFQCKREKFSCLSLSYTCNTWAKSWGFIRKDHNTLNCNSTLSLEPKVLLKARFHQLSTAENASWRWRLSIHSVLRSRLPWSTVGPARTRMVRLLFHRPSPKPSGYSTWCLSSAWQPLPSATVLFLPWKQHANPTLHMTNMQATYVLKFSPLSTLFYLIRDFGGGVNS